MRTQERNYSLVIVLVAIIGGSLLLPPLPVRATASLELYGTFHAMGVIVTLDAGDDPELDAVAMVEYRTGVEPYRAGFPLSRISQTRFVGSLFWLEPGTAYDVRVTFSDPGDALDGVIVAGSGSTRAEITVPAASKSYYVSPTGSGTACTLGAPCSLTEGLSQVQPGEAVVLRGGAYYEGGFSVPRSGTSGNPIVIQGYPGETAVLDGADPATFIWTAQSGGLYRTTVNVADTHLVTAAGERLFPYEDLTNLQNLSRDNTPGFYADGTTLYVHLAGDADPNGQTVIVSRYESAFYVERDHIYFVDLTFRHYGQGAYPKAIYLNNASDNLVQGCTFAANDLGIGIKRDSHRNVVQDNEFYDTIFDWPWGDIKELGGLEDGGVVFYGPTDGRGNVIRRNTFHDDFDGFGACPGTTTAENSNETDVYENVIYNMGDDGMETDGRCSNVRIWSNTFHDVLMGISLAPVYDGPVYAIRNLIYRTGVGNNSYTGSPFKFNSGYDKSGPMYLFHNAADASLPGNNGLYVKAPGSWALIYARNNVWAGTAYAVENYNAGQPIDLDYDDLWNGESGDLVRWDDVRYATLADFTAATGQEPHGLDAAPGFAGAGSSDYTLDITSSLIDAGVAIPGINDGYVCDAPDIGAFEHDGCRFVLHAGPSSNTIDPGGTITYTIGVQPVAGFMGTVALQTSSPSPSLTVSLVPTVITPLDQATLIVTDTHVGVPSVAGSWYHVPITATGGGVTRTTSVGVLLGGVRLYLPLVLKSGPEPLRRSSHGERQIERALGPLQFLSGSPE
jgi:parallel beta-helix repeat protein